MCRLPRRRRHSHEVLALSSARRGRIDKLLLLLSVGGGLGPPYTYPFRARRLRNGPHPTVVVLYRGKATVPMEQHHRGPLITRLLHDAVCVRHCFHGCRRPVSLRSHLLQPATRRPTIRP